VRPLGSLSFGSDDFRQRVNEQVAMKRQKYAIIGTGALGGLYGGMLANSGFDVHFLVHNDYQYVSQHGLTVESPLGDFHVPQVNVHASADSLPPCDVTIVALKTTRNNLLPKLLPPPTREGGIVLVLQNGLDIEAEAAEVVGFDRVLGGCCFLCSNKIGPGHIRHLDYGTIVFGEYRRESQGGNPPGETDRVLRIGDELGSAGIDAKPTGDLLSARWRKLMWNIPFNGLSVVLDASTKDLVEDPNSVALVEMIIREVHSTAARLGVSIPDEAIEKTIDVTRRMVPYDASMRIDYRYRREMEVEAIFGNPLRTALSIGAQMHSVDTLYRQLKFLNSRNLTGA
jgi:2-dehydropantoate 2-reductase